MRAHAIEVPLSAGAARQQISRAGERAPTIVDATLDEPIGQPDFCVTPRRESPGGNDTKLRAVREANVAPSTISRIHCRLRRARRDGRGTLPESCNRL